MDELRRPKPSSPEIWLATQGELVIWDRTSERTSAHNMAGSKGAMLGAEWHRSPRPARRSALGAARRSALGAARRQTYNLFIG
jgi:hypothetical protein